MILKERTESEELLVMRSLNARMELTEKERFHYQNIEKGYEGELQFDLLAQDLVEERYIINDILLEVNNSYFQIDSLIISQGVIHLLDIKNFQGDCFFELDKLYSVKTSREFKNPIIQLQRSATLFRQLLQNLKQNYLVEASVIFINPEFTLYQAPLDQPIILPTRLNSFMMEFNNTSSKLNDGHNKLAQSLISLHQPKNPFSKIPDYHYDQLQKGIYCCKCRSFLVFIKNFDVVCKNCGEHERLEQAILRGVEEFKLLFPERKITTPDIYEWCRLDLSKKTIFRILKKHFTAVGIRRHTYYE
ncbi:nuclease-related domain-containing protein [Bacillus benzoevorans]|uniref:NERD domain-containing protein n=1 Tax=Bacillus benzoevorans TaxID=1456 RepID=A0A7X0LY31_9BACI|nr:nuclease-related domain-containing protein [Bacillus benzoevorans]MBB6447087.1 hypothetical protein [Bacillus benzoevorans]